MLILLNSIAGLVVLTWFSLNTAWWMFFFQVMDGEIILTRSLAHPAAMIPLKRDATPIGSWALLADSCPAGTAECSDVREYTVGKPCCPTGTKCYAHGFGDQSNCCPGDANEECHQTAATFPECADPSWGLYKITDQNYFCCLDGEVGYLTEEGSGACGPGDLKPAGKQVAFLAVQSDSKSSSPPGPSPGVITGIAAGVVVLMILARAGI